MCLCLVGYNEKPKICDQSIALQASMCHGRPRSQLLVVAWEPRLAASRADRACVCRLTSASGGGVLAPALSRRAGGSLSLTPELDRGDQPDWLEDKCVVGGNGEALVGFLCWAGNS